MHEYGVWFWFWMGAALVSLVFGDSIKWTAFVIIAYLYEIEKNTRKRSAPNR